MNSYIRRLLTRSVKFPVARRGRPGPTPLKARLRVDGLEDRTVPSAPPAPPGYANTTTTVTNTTPVTIPTTIASFTSTITVSGAGTFLHDVDLTTFLTHTFNGDMDITLKSPSGTVVTITTDNGGGNDDVFNGTVWDDDADPGNEAPFATATFANSKLVADTLYVNATAKPTLVPEEPLAAFRGENPNGLWTLTLSDDAAGDGGTLASWKMDLTTLNAASTETPVSKFTNSTAVSIPTTIAVATSTITVTGAPTYLNRMLFQTALTHTFNGDMDITLRSPSGTIVTITTDNGGGNDNVYNNTIWDDDADPLNEAPFATDTFANSKLPIDTVYVNATAKPTLTPEEAFGAFIGENPNGTWTLTLSDDAGGDGGTLANWSISLFGVVPVGLPNATASSLNVINAGGTSHSVTVVYADPTGVNQGILASTIATGDITVTGPGAFTATPTFVTVTPAGNGTPLTATYTFTPPGGSWDPADNGPYSINMVANQVADLDLNFINAGPIGTFTVGVPLTFVVTNANDTGTGSLRDAIIAVNTVSTADIITFDPVFFATPRTITLASALPVIADSVTITGPGVGLLSVSGNNAVQVLNSTAPILVMSGFTITAGNAAAGGGGLQAAGTVFLDKMAFTNSTATGSSGGGIFMAGGAFLSIRNSTVSGNTAGVSGGGIYFYGGGGLVVENSTISGNKAETTAKTIGGGGVYFFGTPAAAVPAGFTPSTLVIRNSTLANNSSGGSGGGVMLTQVPATGTLLLQNSTVTGNSAVATGTSAFGDQYGGGGLGSYYTYATFTTQNTIISGNTNADAPDIAAGTSTVNVNFSAVGSSAGFTLSGTSGNNVAFNTDLKLGALANNGGLTQTFLPLAGSPLINAGSNALATGITTDARGNGFLRVSGASVDIGAIEVQPAPTTVTSITPNGSVVTNAATVSWTVTFAAPVTGVSAANFVLQQAGGVTGAAITTVTGGGTTWTVTANTGTGSGTLGLQMVNYNGLTVGVLNLPVSASPLFTIDKVAPTVASIVRADPNPTTAATVAFTVTFSEAVTDVDAADFALTGTQTGATIASVTGSGTVWTVTVNAGPQDNRTVGLNLVDNDTIIDAATNPLGGTGVGNGNLTGPLYTIDNVRPGVTINQAIGQADPTNGASIVFTVVFSETVTGFDAADIALSGTAGGALVANVTGSGPTYTVTVTGMSSTGTVIANVNADGAADALGNLNTAGTSTDNTVTYDITPSNVTINQAIGQSDPTNAPIVFTVEFNEVVTGFDKFDVQLSGTAGGPLTVNVTGSGTTYTVTVSGMSSDGTVIANVPAGAAFDLAGNPSNAATFTDNTVTYDGTPPTVTINQAATQPDPTNVEPYHFEVVFSEPVFGFDENDIILSGTAVPQDVVVVQTGPLTYDVFVSNTLFAGTVIADVAAGGAFDLAGNGNDASTSTDNVITGDTAPPIVTINQAVGQADPTNAGPVLFTVTVNEPVFGFDASDIDLTASTVGGTLVATLTQTGPLTYTVSVTGMTGTGLVIASIPAGAFTDAATNANEDSTSTDNEVTFDTDAPEVTVEQAIGQPDPTNVASIVFTVQFNEAVTGFDNPLTDVILSGSAGGILSATITMVDADTYTVTVSGMTSTGTVIVDVPAGAALDQVLQASLASTSIDNEVTYDIIAPDTQILTTPPLFSPTGDVTFTFTGTDNISSATALTFEYQIDGGGWIAASSPLDLFSLADGLHTFEVRATDAAGNTDPTPASYTFTVDTVTPTVAITTTAPDPTNTSPIPFTATFSEDVTTFDITDIIVTNGTVTNFSGSGMVYTFLIIPAANGGVTVTINDGAAPDPAGNPNTGDSLSVVYDTLGPTITITSTAPNPTNTSPIPVTVTFSEDVFTFDASDLSVANGTVANFTIVDARTYTFDLIPNGEGQVFVGISQGVASDPAGNENLPSTFTIVYDTLGPTATINQASGQADPANGGPILFTVVFSEPVFGFQGGVFLAGTAGATGYTITGSGTTYTVAVFGMTQFGTVIATIAGNAAADAAGNPTQVGTSTDNTVTFDPVAPTVTITPAGGQRDPVSVGPIAFTIQFSKPVTGFTLADVSLASSTAGGNLTMTLSGSGTTYTVTVTGMTRPGDVTLTIGAGAATDAAGNLSLAPTGDNTVTYAGEIFAVGAANGGAPRVDVFNGSTLLYSFFAFESSFRGGVKVAVGDVTGDGIPDIVAGAGFGGSPRVLVFDGRTGTQVASFFAYDDSARGGVFVAVGDVTGDGRPDVITGAGPTGGPHVGIFDGTTLKNVKSFFAFPETFRGGVSVAAGDLNGDGRADVVTGNGTTGEIQVYDGVSGASLRRIAPFYSPADSVLPLGVNMAVGDVTGDGIPDVVIGAGDGGGPLVQVYDGSTPQLTLKNGSFAFDTKFRRGVTVAIRDMTGDGVGEIIAGSGDNGDVAVLDGNSLGQLSLLDPFGPTYAGGVFVG